MLPHGSNMKTEKTALDSRCEPQGSLHRSERAETIAQLTPGIVHDFNNSLQSIVAALELVRKLIAAGRGDEAERFIANAIGTSQRAAALNGRLLRFTNSEPLGPRPMSMNELVLDLEDLLRRTLPASIRLTLELLPDLWDIRCDVEQAQVALLNLILETRDAIPNGGSITIRTCNIVHPAGVAPGEYVSLVITHGASASDRARGVAPSSTPGNGPENAHLLIAGRFARENAGEVRVDPGNTDGGSVAMHLPRYTTRGAPPVTPSPM